MHGCPVCQAGFPGLAGLRADAPARRGTLHAGWALRAAAGAGVVHAGEPSGGGTELSQGPARPSTHLVNLCRQAGQLPHLVLWQQPKPAQHLFWNFLGEHRREASCS